MIHKDHLTNKEKNMHAKKVGTVSSCHQFDKNAVMHCNSYTLYAVSGESCRVLLHNKYYLSPWN